MAELHPDLLNVLAAVDRGEVHSAYLGARRVWFVAGSRNTPAIQCLLDAGLIKEDRERRPPLTLTDAGRDALAIINHQEP